MSKRKNPESDLRVKRTKRNYTYVIPSEIIIKILKDYVIDLLRVEYESNCDIKIFKRKDLMHPVNRIKNILWTSRNVSNLFKLCFRERIVEMYAIDLKLGGCEEDFWKNLVFSAIISIHMFDTKRYFDIVDKSYYYCRDQQDSINHKCSVDLCELFDKLDIKVFFRLSSKFHIPEYDYTMGKSYCTCDCGKKRIMCDVEDDHRMRYCFLHDVVNCNMCD